MANVLGLVQQVEDKLLRAFSIFGFNIVTKIAEHVWRDGEMLRRQSILCSFHGTSDRIRLHSPRRRGWQFSWDQSWKFRLGKETGNFLLETAPTWKFHAGYLRPNM